MFSEVTRFFAFFARYGRFYFLSNLAIVLRNFYGGRFMAGDCFKKKYNYRVLGNNLV